MTGRAGGTIKIPWAAWFGDVELSLEFPSSWEVSFHPPADAPDIGDEGIRQAFANPIGLPRIAELARGRRSAVIVVDDISRPTPAHRVLPAYLDELAEGGIDRDRVLIIMGVACHRQLIREDLEKKLGHEVLETVQVKNHFAWDNCAYLGVTSRGTPVHINRDFLAADLKLTLGGITPHGGPGFGGGAKLILPGISGIETSFANHRPPAMGGPGGRGVGRVDDNEERLDMEEAARMVGLDAIVNTVVNSRRGVAGLFVGEMVAAHRAGVAFARKVFATQVPADVDVGVFNAFPKDTEFIQAGMAFNVWQNTRRPIVREGGTVVLCSAASEGYGFHSLHGPGMRLANVANPRHRFGERRLVVFSPNIIRRDLPPAMQADEDVFLCRTWGEVIEVLERTHGPGTRAAVFPCSAMQLAAD